MTTPLLGIDGEMEARIIEQTQAILIMEAEVEAYRRYTREMLLTNDVILIAGARQQFSHRVLTLRRIRKARETAEKRLVEWGWMKGTLSGSGVQPTSEEEFMAITKRHAETRAPFTPEEEAESRKEMRLMSAEWEQELKEAAAAKAADEWDESNMTMAFDMVYRVDLGSGHEVIEGRSVEYAVDEEDAWNIVREKTARKYCQGEWKDSRVRIIYVSADPQPEY